MINIKKAPYSYALINQLSAYKIISVFYIFYVACALSGSLVFIYPSVSIITYFVFIIFSSSLVFGTFIGEHCGGKRSFPRVDLQYQFILPKLKIMTVICTITVILSWVFIINKYGNIIHIFSIANAIRYDNIGTSETLIPRYLTYIDSFVYASFGLSVSIFTYFRKHIILVCINFLLIVLVDLFYWGRIGIIFAVFMILSSLVVTKFKHLKLFNMLILSITIVCVVILPHYIRSAASLDQDEKTIQTTYIKSPVTPATKKIYDLYFTYFSGFYSLDYYLANYTSSTAFGRRTLTPLFRIYDKLTGEPEYFNTIDEDASNLTINYNVYTVIKDFISDFGIVAGVTIVPVIVGMFIGLIFRYSLIYGFALKIYVLAWVFYTPIFNAFSFGGFLISFAALIVISMLPMFKRQIGHICKNNRSVKVLA